MPRVSIDYMDARRDAKAASGGKLYRLDTNAIDLRDQWRGLDRLEQAALEIDHVFADFRRWQNNLRPVADIMAGNDDDYF